MSGSQHVPKLCAESWQKTQLRAKTVRTEFRPQRGVQYRNPGPIMIAATCSNVSLTDLVRYLHPGSGEFTRLKETLHWHILPEPAREVRTLKPRMNSIAKPSWPPGDNCWSLGARGAPDQVIFCLGTQFQYPTMDFCVLRRKPKNAEHCNHRCCCFSMLTRSSKTCRGSNMDTP